MSRRRSSASSASWRAWATELRTFSDRGPSANRCADPTAARRYSVGRGLYAGGVSVSDGDIYELGELANQPGTYFNPRTEVVVIVDDSASIDQEVFETDTYEGVEWVRVSEEIPVDETALAEALESFQAKFHPGGAGVPAAASIDLDDPDPDAGTEDETLEPDPDPED